MTIREVNHKPDLHMKDATVALDYEEVRDIANAFYYLLDPDGCQPTDSEIASFKKTSNKFNILFDLVKNGCVTQDCIDRCATHYTGELI